MRFHQTVPIRSNASLREEASQKVRDAIRTMSANPNLQEVVVDRKISDREGGVDFPHEDLYAASAFAAGFRVRRAVQQHRFGFEQQVVLERSARYPVSDQGASAYAGHRIGSDRTHFIA